MDSTSLTIQVNNKLRSQAGASITFALLLFLVCAVVSSVILVAATVSAGRMKNVAESDQRYYSVTSAVGYVRDLLDDRTVTVATVNRVKEGAEGTEKTYIVPKTADKVDYWDIGINYNPDATVQKTESELETHNLANLMSFDSLLEYLANKYNESNNAVVTLGVKVGGSEYDSLTATIQGQFHEDGLTLIVYNGGVGNENRYQVTMEFDINKEIVKDDNIYGGPAEFEDKDGYTVSGITKKSYTFHLRSISTPKAG